MIQDTIETDTFISFSSADAYVPRPLSLPLLSMIEREEFETFSSLTLSYFLFFFFFFSSSPSVFFCSSRQNRLHLLIVNDELFKHSRHTTHPCIYIDTPSSTMITMISLYSQGKENVTIFQTLKLFTQYILHQHVHEYIYSISSFRLCLSGLLCNANVYKKYSAAIKGDEREAKREQGRSRKEYTMVHFNRQGWSFFRSVCRVQSVRGQYLPAFECKTTQRKTAQTTSSIHKFVFLPGLYLINYCCSLSVCLKWHSLMLVDERTVQEEYRGHHLLSIILFIYLCLLHSSSSLLFSTMFIMTTSNPNTAAQSREQENT